LAGLPELPAGESASFHAAPDPVRPARVDAGAWRRMSRLGRLVVAAAAPVLDVVTPDAVCFGTLIAEYGPTAAFLDTLFTKGQAGASPLAFQSSVHNAPASHLSLAFGLRGPCDTVCAGPRTAFVALERALVRVTLHGEIVLLVVGDELGPAVRSGLAHLPAPFGEGAAAILLGPLSGSGRAVALSSADPAPGTWRRRHPWPDEAPVASDDAHDARLGLSGAVDLLALVACIAAGQGAVTDGVAVASVIR
jgi:hypothetical protein